MKRLKRNVMNTISNFEVEISMPNNYAMSKKDFQKYKIKYNEALEKATNKVLTLVYNAFGELL